MHGIWTLPLIQQQLDRLAVGNEFALRQSEVERLFGIDDVADTRLANFARGHGCSVLHGLGLGGAVFRKLPSHQRPLRTGAAWT